MPLPAALSRLVWIAIVTVILKLCPSGGMPSLFWFLSSSVCCHEALLLLCFIAFQAAFNLLIVLLEPNHSDGVFCCRLHADASPSVCLLDGVATTLTSIPLPALACATMI